MTKKSSLIALGLQLALVVATLAMALVGREWRPEWLEQAFMASAIAFLLLTPFGLMSIFFTYGYRFLAERQIYRDEVIRRLARGYPETLLMWREARDDIWRKHSSRDPYWRH
ncbi:hypothetical protein GGR20_003356 [Devosia subaequoris]|uniref:Uncharacterized protein n=1 Tax=Devosia subaequoris TaxID=395930 RepID=A0A7W6NCI5_9HYPH|nr:hypothetical protein [Devosia subaequoris]MBB4053694.1 hypothetical protein [Devosia subaequoris]MCP1211105.1 hypothetical protein [Devosia subaequoris]